MQRGLAVLLAVALFSTSASAVAPHVHAFAGHAHDEHHHGLAAHLHAAGVPGEPGEPGKNDPRVGTHVAEHQAEHVSEHDAPLAVKALGDVEPHTDAGPDTDGESTAEIHGCDPAQHAVFVEFVCDSPEETGAPIAVPVDAVALCPPAAAWSTTAPSDLRAHSPPLLSDGPSRAPPVVPSA